MGYATIYAKGEKDIPEWAKQHHDWEPATDVTKLKKLEVRMDLCCRSCEETLRESIRRIPGVFDIKTDKTNDLVTVYETPGCGPNHKQLLKKLKKLDKRAKIVSSSETHKSDSEANMNNVYYVLPNAMTPWNCSQGYSIWPFFTNFNYLQHRVSCGHCLGYADVVCSNCGRSSELGSLVTPRVED